MNEIIKIERFLKMYENTWEIDEFTFLFYEFTSRTEYTLRVHKDFGDFLNLIGFEAELFTVDKSLINEKIKSINSMCDKMISDSDIYMSKMKFEETKVRLWGNYSEPLDKDKTIELKFNDMDLINTICEIKSIIESMPATQKQLTTDASIERLTKIWQLLKGNYIDKSTTIENWLHWFGKKTVENPKKIKWVGADSTLSNVIFQICGTSSEIAISTAFIFKDKYQKPTTKEYKKDYLWSEIDKYLNHAVNKLD